MDIQVLNEIANQLRQVSLSKGGNPVSANARLKGLKGNPIAVPVPAAPPPIEETQGRDTVAPEISSVARAASDYSAVVGNGLNRDELGAIQDLAVRVRTVVSDFLNQPGVAQAENVAALVAANPEGVEALTSSLEQAVVGTLQTASPKEAVTEAVLPANETVIKAIPAANQQISLERVTQGARRNNPDQAVAAIPANVDVRTGTIPESPVTNPVAVETSHGDFRVVAASPALQNAQAGDNAQVETPVSRPEVAATSLPESVKRPEATTTNQQEIPVTLAVSKNHQETPVVAASLAIQNAQAGRNANVEIPVSRPETAAPSQPESVKNPDVTVASQPEAPVTPAVSQNNQKTPVVAASPAIQNAQAGRNANVETPVSRPEATVTGQQKSTVTSTPPAAVDTPVQSAQKEPVNNSVATPVSQGQEPVRVQAPAADTEQAIAPPAINEGASNPSQPQPASSLQRGSAQTRNLFAPEQAAVNPDNIRNVNELVHSVVGNEFSAEAKKIFSEPKVIRTIADLADFILERLREIIATQQQQSQSSVGIS